MFIRQGIFIDLETRAFMMLTQNISKYYTFNVY